MGSEIGTNAQRIELAKAVIATFAAQRTGAQLTGEIQDLSMTPVPDFLTLSPYLPLGYPMTGQLPVLERMALGGPPVEPNSEAGEAATGLTQKDLRFSAATAFLFDKLINPVLPFGPVAPDVFERKPINEPYEQALRGAQFAGSEAEASPEVLAAEAVLRRTDENGKLVFTEEYLTYLDFEERVQAAQDQLAELGPDASPADREAAQREVERLEAEWVAVGHKKLIDDAFQTIHDAGEQGGFGRERVRLIDQLEAFERLRLDAVGQTYVESQLAPLTPLLATAEDHIGWERVELDADEIRHTLQPAVRAAFELTDEAITTAVERLRTLRFEITSCGVVRDWFEPDFFSKHYWRLPSGDLLSDGHGGGTLPGYASQVIFIRGVVLEYVDEVVALFGDEQREIPESQSRIVRLVNADLDGRQLSVSTALATAQQRGLGKAAAMLKSEQVRLAAPTAKLMHINAAAIAKATVDSPVSDSPALERSPQPAGIISSVRGGISRLATLRPRLGDRPRVIIRDHRDERPDGRRPRVRDHRDRDGFHWVPRHRVGGKWIRGHWERDRANEHVPSKPAFRRVQFNIKISADDGTLLDGISLEGLQRDGEQVSFGLRRESGSELVCEQEVQVSQSEEVEPELTLVLHDGKGDRLDQRTIQIDDDAIDLQWTVQPEIINLGLTYTEIPSLFGYALTIVPRCPTPDPTLNWP